MVLKSVEMSLELILFCAIFIIHCDSCYMDVFHLSSESDFIVPDVWVSGTGGDTDNPYRQDGHPKPIIYKPGDQIEYTCSYRYYHYDYHEPLKMSWIHSKDNNNIYIGERFTLSTLAIKMKLYKIDNDTKLSCYVYKVNIRDELVKQIDIPIFLRSDYDPDSDDTLQNTTVYTKPGDIIKMTCPSDAELFAVSKDNRYIIRPNTVINVADKLNNVMLMCIMYKTNKEYTTTIERHIRNITILKVTSYERMQNEIKTQNIPTGMIAASIIILTMILTVLVIFVWMYTRKKRCRNTTTEHHELVYADIAKCEDDCSEIYSIPESIGQPEILEIPPKPVIITKRKTNNIIHANVVNIIQTLDKEQHQYHEDIQLKPMNKKKRACDKTELNYQRENDDFNVNNHISQASTAINQKWSVSRNVTTKIQDPKVQLHKVVPESKRLGWKKRIIKTASANKVKPDDSTPIYQNVVPKVSQVHTDFGALPKIMKERVEGQKTNQKHIVSTQELNQVANAKLKKDEPTTAQKNVEEIKRQLHKNNARKLTREFSSSHVLENPNTDSNVSNGDYIKDLNKIMPQRTEKRQRNEHLTNILEGKLKLKRSHRNAALELNPKKHDDTNKLKGNFLKRSKVAELKINNVAVDKNESNLSDNFGDRTKLHSNAMPAVTLKVNDKEISKRKQVKMNANVLKNERKPNVQFQEHGNFLPHVHSTAKMFCESKESLDEAEQYDNRQTDNNREYENVTPIRPKYVLLLKK